ncbi:hypothetical protein [Candidatus Protochlamydia phocaeensis]|uniref:hypothetical protein n=1 Tax=Candidatus Protochlamydia phocaeensis TaxID=1414722 RepID=UPI000AED6B77|nr:hypothetical protein [Candidatus Protochlamydia phocaeensis]
MLFRLRQSRGDEQMASAFASVERGKNLQTRVNKWEIEKETRKRTIAGEYCPLSPIAS